MADRRQPSRRSSRTRTPSGAAAVPVSASASTARSVRRCSTVSTPLPQDIVADMPFSPYFLRMSPFLCGKRKKFKKKVAFFRDFC